MENFIYHGSFQNLRLIENELLNSKEFQGTIIVKQVPANEAIGTLHFDIPAEIIIAFASGAAGAAGKATVDAIINKAKRRGPIEEGGFDGGDGSNPR